IYRLQHRAIDLVRNAGSLTPTSGAANVLILDTTPPSTVLAVGAPSNHIRYPDRAVIVTSHTPLIFASSDGGVIPAGVMGVSVYVDGTPLPFIGISGSTSFFAAAAYLPASLDQAVSHTVTWQAE